MRVLGLLLVFNVFSAFQPTPGDGDFFSRLKLNLEAYHQKFAREQVYMHVDRTFFQPGDDLWFKAYVVNVLNDRLSLLSKTLSVFLVDASGNEVVSGQFLIRSGRSHGDFKLPSDLPSGAYKLVAYTSWMKNFDPKDVFMQEIKVSDHVIPNLFVNARFSKNLYTNADEVLLHLNFTDLTGKLLSNFKSDYTITNGFENLAGGKLRTNESGEVNLVWQVPDASGFESYLIRMSGSHNDQPFNFQWLVPTTARLIDLQLLPEGGYLLEGKSQTVAFKATDQFGRNLAVEGAVVNAKGAVVANLETTYEGMGQFSVDVRTGERYEVRLSGEYDGQTFEMPQALKSGAILKAKMERPDTVSVSVLGSQERDMVYHLVGMQNEKIEIYERLEFSGDTTIHLPESIFSMGIVRFTLFNDRQIPVSERLVFANREKSLDVTITTETSQVGPRSVIQGKLAVKDHLGEPVKSVFSLAATDAILANVNKRNSTSITSHLLLQSDLKGNVPTPDYYFVKDNPYSGKALDLVMLTHGWRRFLWDYVLMKDLGEEPMPINHDLKSGTVFDKKGRAVVGAEVQIVQLGSMQAYFLETDSRGKFYLPFNISTASSMDFVFNAVLPGKKGPLEVRLDTEENDPFRASIFSTILPTQGDLAQVQRERKKGQDLDVFENLDFGDNYRLLREVEIYGASMQKAEATFDVHDEHELRNQMSVMSHYFVQSRDQDQLNVMATGSTTLNGGTGGFIDIVKQISNIYNYNPRTGYVILRTNDLLMNAEKRLGALVVLNGTPVGQDLRTLNHLTASEIEKIDVIKTSAMAVYYGNRAAAGAILVTTKRGVSKQMAENVMTESDVEVNNNFTLAREFYAPKYETQLDLESAVPDARKTLFWIPELATDDEGNGYFEFYADDRETSINIEVQGLSGDGRFGFANTAVQVRNQ